MLNKQKALSARSQKGKESNCIVLLKNKRQKWKISRRNPRKSNVMSLFLTFPAQKRRTDFVENARFYLQAEAVCFG